MASRRLPAPALPLQNILNILPKWRRDNRPMFTVIQDTFVSDLADVDRIGQQIVEAGFIKQLAAAAQALARPPAFADPAPALQCLDYGHKFLLLAVKCKDGAHAPSLL